MKHTGSLTDSITEQVTGGDLVSSEDEEFSHEDMMKLEQIPYIVHWVIFTDSFKAIEQ